MYNSRKKIIITMVVIFLIIILAIAGILVYITTDIFKSNQVLFYKYMGQTFENIKYVENTQLSEIENLKNQKPYTIEGALSFDAQEENTDINANMLSRMNLNIESKVNKPEEKAYTKANLTHNNQDLFRVEYANSNNIYALKSDEIVTNLSYVLQNKSFMFKLLKWTTGEISLFKDLANSISLLVLEPI